MEDRTLADQFDMSREFTCYLCNGQTTMLGSVTVTVAGIKLVNAAGMTLEIDEFEDLVSVNEMEPANDHTLILVFHDRYVLVSHLLRKEKLVEFFKDVGLYKDEPQLPPEAIGMYDPHLLNDVVCSDRDPSTKKLFVDSRLLFANREHASRDSGHVTGSKRRDKEEDEEEEEEENPWDNKLEQDRHIQRQIRQQSLLNPVQLLSSIQQERALDINQRNSYAEDFKQLDKFPSSTRKTNTSKPEEERVDRPLSSSKSSSSSQQTTANSSSVSNLKLLFPKLTDEELVSVLAKSNYDLDTAISAILGENDLANAFPK